MKKFVILTLFFATLWTVKELSTSKQTENPLLLYNIEALASNSEGAPVTRCYGKGTVDCPKSHSKVEWVITGYSLEE